MSNVLRFGGDMNKPIWAINAETKMKTLGLGQKDLLDVFSVGTTGAIGHYFNGRREPEIYTIVKLAEKLNTPLLELLGVDSSPKLNPISIGSEKYLTDAFRLLSRIAGLSENEIRVFFTAYEKMGPENIIKAVEALSSAGDNSNDQVDAIIKIQDFMKKAG